LKEDTVLKPYEAGSVGERSTTRFPKPLVAEFSKKFFDGDYAVMEDSGFSLTEFDEARNRIIVRMRRASQNLDELVSTIDNRVGSGVNI